VDALDGAVLEGNVKNSVLATFDESERSYISSSIRVLEE
jgi:hypothetical protein